MQQIGDVLYSAWQWLTWHATHMSLAMALWIGTALLTLVLLVLMRTRWGQVAPIWKCVVLSIFAHILLGAYAYGTHLIFVTPRTPSADPFSVTMHDADEPPEAEDEETTQSRPWDEIELEDDTAPETSPADRLASELEPDVQRTVPSIAPDVTPPAWETPALADQPLVSRPEARSDAAPLQPDRREIQGQVSAQPITFRPNQAREESAVASPVTRSAARMESGLIGPIPEGPAGEPGIPAELETEQVNTLIQKLAAGALLPRTDQPAGPPWPPGPDRVMTAPAESATSPGPRTSVVAPRRLADGQPMPELYDGRHAGERERRARQYGGGLLTEQSVELALRWLADHQEPAGNWSAARHGGGRETLVYGHDRQGAGSHADTGVTGLALLALLGAGHTHLEGPYRVTVQRGLEYLINHQASDGNLAGDARLFARMYCHAMASLALSEALATTGDSRLRDPVQRAVNYSLLAQNRHGGGWRYRPGDRGDMSQFGWQVMALKSAELGGIPVPAEAKRLMKLFLARSSSGPVGGLAAYQPGGRPTVTMTAEALLCRHFLFDSVPQAVDQEAGRMVLQQLPGQGETNYYYWYYATLALFHAGGSDWDVWNENLVRTLTGTQTRSGPEAGSWEPGGVWCGYGGRVYSTAISALCLEVYYRYSRQ